jgi:hypothetical protein
VPSYRPGESYEEARRAFDRTWLAGLIASHAGDLASAAHSAGLDDARLAEMLAEAGIAPMTTA